MTNTNQTGGPRRWQDDSEYKRLKRIEGALVRVIAATKSHIDGRDLLDELHPRRSIDIKVRVDSRERWHEGDWLSSLRSELRLATKALGPLPMSLDAMREAVANADAEGVAAPEPATPAGPEGPDAETAATAGEAGGEGPSGPDAVQIPDGFKFADHIHAPHPESQVEVYTHNPDTGTVSGPFSGQADEFHWFGNEMWDLGEVDQEPVYSYRIASQPAPDAEKPASEQDAAPLPEHKTDAGSAPEAAQGAGTPLPEGYSPISEWDAEATGREAWVSFWYSNGGETPVMANDPLLNGDSIRCAQGFKLIDRTLYELNSRRGENGQPAYVLKPDPATHIEHDGTGYMVAQSAAPPESDADGAWRLEEGHWRFYENEPGNV